MANHVLLNNVDHKDLKVITSRSADYGDNVMYAITFPAEFGNLQAEYPIFFHKDHETGKFHAVAMFGFEPNENLYLNDEGWGAYYIPLTIQQQPFLIGFQNRLEDGVPKEQTVIHVDMDNPRISTTEGESVFLPHGGISEYLERINSILHAIREGLAQNQEFMEALIELELLESFTLDVELDDGSQHRLVGFYTINEDRLNELDGEALARLNEKRFLQPVYMAVASVANIRKLIDFRNARLKENA